MNLLLLIGCAAAFEYRTNTDLSRLHETDSQLQDALRKVTVGELRRTGLVEAKRISTLVGDREIPIDDETTLRELHAIGVFDDLDGNAFTRLTVPDLQAAGLIPRGL